MGTRHLTCVTLDGGLKVAQYGQWDGYPDGVGVELLAFLKGEHFDRPTFTKHARNLRWWTDEDQAALDAQTGLAGKEWITMEEADAIKAAAPQVSRDTSWRVLLGVADGTLEVVKDSSDFGLESLFCEWAYNVDLDEGVLEVYEGFNTGERPTTGIWAGRPTREELKTELDALLEERGVDNYTKGKQEEYDNDSGYKAVQIIATFPLDDLPDEETFLKTITAASRYPDEED